MAVFAFKAHDKRTNKEISDSVEAGSEVEAIATIKRRGFLPIEVKEVRAKSGKTAASGDKKGGGDKDAAATVGKLVAQRAIEKGVKDVVFDRGGFIYHGRIKALADAAREAGLNF